MRYIDADKLKEVFDEHEDDYGYLHGDWEEFIDNAPTADVRENVRGHWELKTDGFGGLSDNVTAWANYCSVCGYHYGTPYNFCPNCGADMRGDNNGKRNDS